MLHHERIEVPGHAPDRWLLVFHGIFGAGRNWATLVRRVVADRPDWGAVLVDLREHGRSLGLEPPHTLEAAADDVQRLVEEADLTARAVLGHSFGGKVALAFAHEHGQGLEQIWVVDSTPGAGEPRGRAWAMLRTLEAMPDRYATRLRAVAAMEREGIATPVAQWMATNLEPAPDGGFRWRIDLTAMEELLLDFFRTDLWPVIESPPAGAAIHVVKAAESNVLAGDAVARIRRASERTGRVHLHEVEGGHWLNADNPDALHTLLVASL